MRKSQAWPCSHHALWPPSRGHYDICHGKDQSQVMVACRGASYPLQWCPGSTKGGKASQRRWCVRWALKDTYNFIRSRGVGWSRSRQGARPQGAVPGLEEHISPLWHQCVEAAMLSSKCLSLHRNTGEGPLLTTFWRPISIWLYTALGSRYMVG